MCYLLMKISVLRYLLSENRSLLWNFGTPLHVQTHTQISHVNTIESQIHFQTVNTFQIQGQPPKKPSGTVLDWQIGFQVYNSFPFKSYCMAPSAE